MKDSQAKDLFQLQTELIDMRVDMAVSKTIDRAIAQLSDLIHNEVQVKVLRKEAALSASTTSRNSNRR